MYFTCELKSSIIAKLREMGFPIKSRDAVPDTRPSTV